MRKELVVLADMLTKVLKDEGIVIQRYDSYSSNSVYLKLDYGVSYSIRISDHPGKSYLKYRYNIGIDIPEYIEDLDDSKPRYYYNIADYEKMLDRILSERMSKIEKYGMSKYQKFMKSNRRSSKNIGFWSRARIV